MVEKRTCSWCQGTGRRNDGAICTDCDGDGNRYYETVDEKFVSREDYVHNPDDDD
jgi:DnaJ-class molecular chaperone